MTVTFIAALFPVVLYIVLVYVLDRFALLSKVQLLVMVVLGMITALICFGLFWLLDSVVSPGVSDYLYPVLEESVKAIPLMALARRKKMVFFIDSIICGAAIGGGFSILENIFYLVMGEPLAFGTALFRGLEVALIHMGCSAMVAEACMFIVRLGSRGKVGLHVKISDNLVVLVLLIAAPLLHVLHNNLQLNPIIQFVLIFGSMAGLLLWTYQYDAEMINRWLDRGLDKQIALIGAIQEGQLVDTPTGQYLMSVKDSFPAEVFFDIICYVQLYLELSVASKSRYLLKEAGLDEPIQAGEKQSILDKYSEFNILEKRLSKSARMAIAPVVKFYPADRRALDELLFACR
ncbi:MAG: PrsW family intramembrane metalloprotease [Bacteroidales bacterium]|nr:PrsW family intramembrane metalloprotease [Bacteroidales bacterium]